MGEYSSWVTHKGKRVLVQDYRGCVGQEVIIAIRANEAFSRSQKVKSGIRVMTDFTDVYADRESLKVLKESAKEFRDYFDKRAVVGVIGVQRFFLAVVNQFAEIKVMPFDTREQALEWLVSDEE